MRLLPSLVAFLACAAVTGAQQVAAPVATETVRAIEPPIVGLPSEEASAGITRFSFIAYGDTRGQVNGQELQPGHTGVIAGILDAIKTEAAAGFPVRFVIQSGDAVTTGGVGAQWNLTFAGLIERLTREAGVPYFLSVGNHDIGGAPAGSSEHDRLQNTFAAMAKLWPPEGSPRRLDGYATYAFGFGRFFFIALDSNIVSDQTQLSWVTKQLDGLDRARYTQIVAFFHHPPITSGSHGGPLTVERQSADLRSLYLPLFRRHHVRLLIAGHDHLLDHWVERYEDETGTHRMDQLVTGGGGAPTYVYRGEPDVQLYAYDASPQPVQLEHLAKPGPTIADNPNHFVIIEADGDRLWLQVVGTGPTPYLPYGAPKIELTDAPR